MFRLLILLIAIQDQPAQGPLSDVIEKRLQEMLLRSEERHAEVSGAYSRRFDEMLKAMQEVRAERAEMNTTLSQFRSEREGLISRINEVSGMQSGILGRLENIQKGFDSVEKRWTPIQNLVDRLTGLVWKLFWLTVSVFIITIIIGSVGLFLYTKLRWKIVTLAKGK